ncbi:MAG TPA: hypothetical protein PKV71_04095 [Calditrichia bacterium]|nr:hypothetical protein [Calditrichia bacterium]HQV31030.1 hypothetical protein [Calditrichia bacterium]
MSIRIPEELKDKAMQLARKNNISFNSLVNHWLRAAVMQDETLEWMRSRLNGKDPEALIAQFGKFLEQTQPGEEPSPEEIKKAMR